MDANPTPEAAPQEQPAVEPVPQGVALTSQTVFQNFFIGELSYMDDGGVQLNFITRLGELLSFPIGEDQKKKLARQMLAPQVEVADRMPPAEVLNGGGQG